MLSAGNMRVALQQQGINMVNQGWRDLNRVITALREDVPITDMEITLDGDKRVPLDQHLATIRE